MDLVWRVNSTFLSPKDDWKGMLAILACVVARGKAAELLSDFTRRRLNAIAGNAETFSRAILSYVVAVVLLSPVDVVFNELVSRLRRYWSHKLTMVLANKMMRQKLRNEDDDKNFETLVSSEADRFVELQIELSIEALEAMTHLFFFTRILWRLSPTLGSAGLATAAFGTSASFLFGRRALARLFREERKANGAFSHNLSRCRENLESIQFANGTSFELVRINELDSLRQRATADRKRAKDLFGMSSSLLRRLAGGVLPSVILRREHEEGNTHGHGHGEIIVPRTQGHSNSSANVGKSKNKHDHGHSHSSSASHDDRQGHGSSGGQTEALRPMILGVTGNHPKIEGGGMAEVVSELAQASEAFDEILFHLMIVTENFHNATRLLTLGKDICDLLDRKPQEIVTSHIALLKDKEVLGDTWLKLSELTVRVPKSEQLLLEGVSIKLSYGDTLLITGPSGCGKTALLRVLFGLWPASGGNVSRPDDSRMIVLPQKPFCSTGTLAEQVTYPKLASSFTRQMVEDALRRVGLGHLLERHTVDAIEKWQEELSMGEMQRLGFARIALHKPEFAFLDESSSSLDLESETRMYDLVTEIVKGGFISIGHRKSIEKFHLHKIVLTGPQGGGKWKQEF